MPAEIMKSFEPNAVNGADTYNEVAELYDAAFTDIRVRQDEWKWLNDHLPTGSLAGTPGRDVRAPGIDLLDIGCGNGALLNALSDRLGSGVGVDESASILEKARARNSENSDLRFD